MRFSLKLLSRISEKVIKNVFRWKRRQIKKNWKFSNFWQIQFYRKAIAFDKIGGNYVLSANSTKICLLGYFCMQSSYLRWKQFQILRFSWKMQKKKKKNRKMISFGNFCSFFEIYTETLEALSANSTKICLLGYFCMKNSYLRWKQFKILQFSWKMQKNRKMISFDNFCSFFEVFTETLEHNIRKSHKKCF